MASILYQATPRSANASVPHAPAQAEQARTARINTMGQFAASIAHEVNQPLSAIALNASAALRWLEQDPPRLDHVRDALNIIASAGSHASDMIRSLRCLACKHTGTPTTFPADEPAREVLLLLHTELQQQGIAIESLLTLGQQALRADRVQVQQVLMNLATNAVDAMRANREHPRTLRLSSRRDGAMLHFSVADSGSGVAPEAQQRIYEALYSTRPDGMGLGLAICRAIVEAHGGQLWHEAARTRGAIFHFTVPAP
ncbi:sensor histidine kinase [Janthinobacterium psychrotolerans]|uniref:histidine kinase n=1 Tax=Janthinobacterium psychrotolerans TaxID=1747903 RepID=A0A1A7C658_9BURK|nr:HAMP domain-containing sensor histidine kinase [Janthinobacterium psychrotolerans]OBV39803.1 His Kinase A (phospho-acceptor) domain-containing protein [Janthinobacterium psychrotolerans]